MTNFNLMLEREKESLPLTTKLQFKILVSNFKKNFTLNAADNL